MNIGVKRQMRFLAFLTTLLIGLAVACSQQEGNKTDDSETASLSDTSGAVAEMDQRTKDSIEIDKVIKTGLTRWKYRDKRSYFSCSKLDRRFSFCSI